LAKLESGHQPAESVGDVPNPTAVSARPPRKKKPAAKAGETVTQMSLFG